MIKGLFILFLFQSLGEAIHRFAHVPVPGAVIGMMLLFLSLPFFGALSDDLANASSHLIRHMSLLFVPAATGFIFYLLHSQNQTIPILAVVSLGTVIVIVVTALVMKNLVRGSYKPDNGTSKVSEHDH